jgi:hypothetical protein
MVLGTNTKGRSYSTIWIGSVGGKKTMKIQLSHIKEINQYTAVPLQTQYASEDDRETTIKTVVAAIREHQKGIKLKSSKKNSKSHYDLISNLERE